MRNRRALSSVVGMVFAIIALTATLAYVSFSMNTLSQYNNAVLNQNQVSLNSGKERFAIASVTIPNGKFNITVANTGNLPINLTKIWVQNTTSPDWMKNYVPSNGFVAPGGTVTNIGQSIPGNMYTTKAYYVKLVTSRGNTQAFTVNSASTAPLNIQLLALPSSVPSGFTTELVMIVTNNGSSTLTNVAPTLPSQTGGSATCSLGTVSPPSYNTLPPGGTAVFKWDLTASGSSGAYCTFSAQLQNGYTGNTAQATVTVTAVKLVPATTYAQYAGIMTINYTTFQWSQGTTWNKGWSFPGPAVTVFAMNVTNNNATSGGYTFWISQNTQFMLYPTQSTNAKNTPTTFFIINQPLLNPLGLAAPYVDNSIGIPNGQTKTIYFGAFLPGGSCLVGGSPQSCGGGSAALAAKGTYTATVAVYGKFTINSGDAGASYAQSIPFIAAVLY